MQQEAEAMVQQVAGTPLEAAAKAKLQQVRGAQRLPWRLWKQGQGRLPCSGLGACPAASRVLPWPASLADGQLARKASWQHDTALWTAQSSARAIACLPAPLLQPCRSSSG
jgi:hypothetical protein